MKHPLAVSLMALVLLFVVTGPAVAGMWQSTSMSLLYGTKNQAINFGTMEAEEVDKTIITMEHASGWKYGDNFFFFDLSQPFDTNSGIYGEWHPRLSASKITGQSVGMGFIKDVLLATEINMDTGWRAYMYGLGFDLDIPHFKFFSINFFIRDDMTINDSSTWQISPSWNIPFSLGGARFEFGGFLDYSGAQGQGEGQILTSPQLLLDVSNFAGKPGNFFAGIEYQYWQNKKGVEGVDENYVQFMTKWFF